MEIYLSGLHSGPNPSPGVGIARSLRLAYPDARLVGVDYSNRSSGIHWPEFDEIWLQRPFGEIDLDAYAEQIRVILDSGALWISGLDLEGMWLSRTVGVHDNLLSPPSGAFDAILKPDIKAHKALNLKVPPFIDTKESEWDLYEFCRLHSWRVWVKGPYHEAHGIRNWRDVESARRTLAELWSTDDIFLQTHIQGLEESIIFAAYKGVLLSTAYMRKRDVTSEGKVWSAQMSHLPQDIEDRLRLTVADLNWTGGAEIELVRDLNDQHWVIDWNPRFPAWIHGATLGGFNLPAQLVAREQAVAANGNAAHQAAFTRVVIEIPTRPEFPLPLPRLPVEDRGKANSKHPSGTTALATRLYSAGELIGTAQEAKRKRPNPDVPATVLSDLDRAPLEIQSTPAHLFLEETAQTRFALATSIQDRFQDADVKVAVAYSIKTNPDERLLRMALESNMLAEAISLYEVQAAINAGFDPERVVLNGPAKWWPAIPLPGKLHSIYCDSIEELRNIIDGGQADLASRIGVRVRPPRVKSRFGIPIDSFKTFQEMTALLGRLPADQHLGIHFHMASSAVGVEQWWELFNAVIEWSRSIERVTEHRVETLDLGGGWFPDDLNNQLEPRMMAVVSRASSVLSNLRNVVIEPGKALAQPTMAVLTRVLEVRNDGDKPADVVVDASVAELTEGPSFPHRVLWCDPESREWKIPPGGKGRILGRLCMEHDILVTELAIPSALRTGDLLAICDAGAYDRSMTYEFGKG